MFLKCCKSDILAVTVYKQVVVLLTIKNDAVALFKNRLRLTNGVFNQVIHWGKNLRSCSKSTKFSYFDAEWDLMPRLQLFGSHTFAGGTSASGYISSCCSDNSDANTLLLYQYAAKGDATTTIAFHNRVETLVLGVHLRLRLVVQALLPLQTEQTNFSATGVGVYEYV